MNMFGLMPKKETKIDFIPILKSIPISDWAQIWCELNSWKMPEQLHAIKPYWWKDMDLKNTEKMSPFIRPIREYIEGTIGKKTISRQWNKDRMTDEQFEFFWDNDYEVYYKKYHPND